MNVLDVMDELGQAPELSTQTIYELLSKREETFKGFMQIEKERGILQYPIDMRTPVGQDCARLLFWRGLEEYYEAISAESEVHRLEEIIDSFNYLSVCILHDTNTPTHIAPQVYQSFKNVFITPEPHFIAGRPYSPTQMRLATVASRLASLTEHFRNRAWMQNAQDTYYVGGKEYDATLLSVIEDLIRAFPDWPTFWAHFTAKDEVLQFRLRSRY